VPEAEVFRHDEARAQPAVVVGLHLGDFIADRFEVAAMIFGPSTFQFPFTVRHTSASSWSGGSWSAVTVTSVPAGPFSGAT